MPLDAGPKLLRDWIARAAARDPDKPWIVSRRRRAHGQLRRSCATLTRPHRHASCARRGLGRNDRVALLANNSIEHLVCYFGVMAYGATICTVHVEMNRNQLDNIFARLKPKLVLLSGWPRARRSSRRRLGAADAARTLGRAGDRNVLRRGRALRAERRADRRRAGRRRRDPVHLRHQRQAEGRGAELSRASRRTSIRPPTASASRRTTGSTISARSTGPRRSFSARWCRSIAAPRW